MDREELLDRVFEQMKQDIDNGDFTAIEELLRVIPEDMLLAFLPEEKQNA